MLTQKLLRAVYIVQECEPPAGGQAATKVERYSVVGFIKTILHIAVTIIIVCVWHHHRYRVLATATFGWRSLFMKRAEKKDYDVYPGKYSPGYENILREKKKRKLQLVPQQDAVIIQEQRDSYKVELCIPGVTRENIFIHCSAGHLYITTQHYNAWKNKNELPAAYKSDFAGIHITLPADADAEFACAEYKDGSLHMYIPKSLYRGNPRIDHIVVY